MSYRPITDVWLLARPKLTGGVKYYGAYLGGFPERARTLLGVSLDDPVLHVCGGMARNYPYPRAFGPNDKTLDLNPDVSPDYLQDAAAPLPEGFRAYLMDPPYSEVDAEHYPPGAKKYPAPGRMVANAIAVLPIGGRVGIIHYLLPRPPANAKLVAVVGVVCGFGNRMRTYSVFEKVPG